MKLFFGLVVSLFSFLLSYSSAFAQNSVAGLYRTTLHHEGTKLYQFANITLRTTNPDGQVKISANVRVFFGGWNSTEYLTYDYPDVAFNFLTRELNITKEENDISLIGKLKEGGLIEGEWFSSQNGKVGKFTAYKNTVPTPPENGVLVKALSGHYRGTIKNTNPDSNLPELVTMSFVSTQQPNTPEEPIRISGNTRLYLGDFSSSEYVETEFTDVQFNFYNRALTAKTKNYGLTYKGTMTHEGVFEGVIFSDGLGEVGALHAKRYPN